VSTILAIDPGDQESAYCLIDVETRQPQEFAKVPNDALRRKILTNAIDADSVAIEMIASYGMAVGATVFDTCVWIGRFCEAVRCNWYPFSEPDLIKRQPVKLHHCKSAKAKDSNVRQALIDRFGAGASNGGKGTKADPGWFYGFAADVWQSYALAVFVADTQAGEVQ
jgi:hypothetical protein